MRRVLTFLTLIVALAAIAAAQNPATAVFPGAVATDDTLGVVCNSPHTTLASAVSPTGLSFNVTNGGVLCAPGFLTLDTGTPKSEVVKICSVSGNTVTVCSGGRHFHGTATGHAVGAIVDGLLDERYINQLSAEVKAIEGSLGANLSNVGSGSGGGLAPANNLSDLTNVATARINLGLGTAATQASSAFEPAITAGTTTQFYRGDKTFQPLTSTAVTEGANLYFTNSRVLSAMAGLYEVPMTFGTGLTRTVNAVGCNTANGSTFGCVSAADWTTFNNKQAAISGAPGTWPSTFAPSAHNHTAAEITSLSLASARGGTGVSNTATLTLGTSNQNWGALGTGIVKNTTTTGAITNAVFGDVVALFGSGSCSGFLKHDGTCAASGGSGTVTTTGTPTATTLATFSSSTVIQTPCATCTLDSGGNMGLAGGVSTGIGSGEAAVLALGQGTAPSFGSGALQIPTTGYNGWVGAASGVTASYLLRLPVAVPAANQIPIFPAPTSGLSQAIWVTPKLNSDTVNVITATVGAGGVVANTAVKWGSGADAGKVVAISSTEGALGIARTTASAAATVVVDVLGASTLVASGSWTQDNYIGTNGADLGQSARSAIATTINVLGKAATTCTNGVACPISLIGQYSNGTALPAPAVSTGTAITLAAPAGFADCTSTCTVTLPVPVAGYQFCVRNDTGVSTAITLAALGSSAMYEFADGSAYGTPGTGTLSSTAAAQTRICLVARDSTHYQVYSATGTWTAN